MRLWLRVGATGRRSKLRGDLSFPLRLRQPACKNVSLEENRCRSAFLARPTTARRNRASAHYSAPSQNRRGMNGKRHNLCLYTLRLHPMVVDKPNGAVMHWANIVVRGFVVVTALHAAGGAAAEDWGFSAASGAVVRVNRDASLNLTGTLSLPSNAEGKRETVPLSGRNEAGRLILR